MHFGKWVRETNICTGGDSGVGTCSGDSGGPLVITNNGRQILVGNQYLGMIMNNEFCYFP